MCGRGDWKSASEPKKITLKTTCCKIYLSNKIKHLWTQSPYFSNTPPILSKLSKHCSQFVLTPFFSFFIFHLFFSCNLYWSSYISVRVCRLGDRASSLPELEVMVFLLPLTGKQAIYIFEWLLFSVYLCFITIFVFSKQK